MGLVRCPMCNRDVPDRGGHDCVASAPGREGPVLCVACGARRVDRGLAVDRKTGAVTDTGMCGPCCRAWYAARWAAGRPP